MSATGFDGNGEFNGGAVVVDGVSFVNVALIRTSGRVGYMQIDGIVARVAT